MAHSMEWQKNLRRSDGDLLPRGPMIAKQGLKKSSRRLSSVDEGAENSTALETKKRSTRGSSLSEFPASVIDSKPAACFSNAITKTPSKINKGKRFLAPLPRLIVDARTLASAKAESIPSPIPLPKGVHNIDPEDDGTLVYGADMVNYMRSRDQKYKVNPRAIFWGEPRRERSRGLLVDWLIEVAHHMRTCQETLYHTVGIMDRATARWRFDYKQLQLLGIASFLIATKQEEYYAADLEELVRLTDKSYTIKEVIQCEAHLLQLLSFDVNGSDPMLFIRRYTRAAFRDNDNYFYELCIFFVDSLMNNAEVWAEPTSKQAAAAVFSALHVLVDKEVWCVDVWTPTLVYYSGFEAKKLMTLASQMLKILLQVQQNDIKNMSVSGLKIKYTSKSRHRNLLGHPEITVDKIEDVLDRLINPEDE